MATASSAASASVVNRRFAPGRATSPPAAIKSDRKPADAPDLAPQGARQERPGPSPGRRPQPLLQGGSGSGALLPDRRRSAARAHAVARPGADEIRQADQTATQALTLARVSLLNFLTTRHAEHIVNERVEIKTLLDFHKR